MAFTRAASPGPISSEDESDASSRLLRDVAFGASATGTATPPPTSRRLSLSVTRALYGAPPAGEKHVYEQSPHDAQQLRVVYEQSSVNQKSSAFGQWLLTFRILSGKSSARDKMCSFIQYASKLLQELGPRGYLSFFVAIENAMRDGRKGFKVRLGGEECVKGGRGGCGVGGRDRGRGRSRWLQAALCGAARCSAVGTAQCEAV